MYSRVSGQCFSAIPLYLYFVCKVINYHQHCRYWFIDVLPLDMYVDKEEENTVSMSSNLVRIAVADDKVPCYK